LPAWFETYLGLETETSRLSIFEFGALPDLLQAGDYTTAVLDAKSTTPHPGRADHGGQPVAEPLIAITASLAVWPGAGVAAHQQGHDWFSSLW
jgi:hypothetical protein